MVNIAVENEDSHAIAATNGSIPPTYMYSWTVQLERSRIWLLKDFFLANPVCGALDGFDGSDADVVDSTFGGCLIRGDRFSPPRWAGKVTNTVRDLPGPLVDQTPVSSN